MRFSIPFFLLSPILFATGGCQPTETQPSDPDSAGLDSSTPGVDSDTVDTGSAPEGTRYVRVRTTDSPSWVAWSEIEVLGHVHGEDAVSHVLEVFDVEASSETTDQEPGLAVDGDLSTSWNAGAFAPAWILLDLGALWEVTQVRLRVTQSPAGSTSHVLETGSSPETLLAEHSFSQRTENGDWLVYSKEEDMVEQWRRRVLSFPDPTPTGNPFEVVIEGVFTHHSSGTVLRLPGYYDGNNVWKLGFMPTLPGDWEWTTESPDPDLDGQIGSFHAFESQRPGFLARDPQHPDKWRYANGNFVVPIGVMLHAMLDDASLEQVETVADYLQQNHLSLINFRLSENDLAFSDVGALQMDLGLWQRLEARMEVLAERGLGVDVMLYTDDSGRPSYPAGSPAEELLIRYAVARLAGYPVVFFNTGIDLAEYRNQAWVDWFGSQVRALDPYEHPVSSRYTGGSGNLVMSGQTYNSVGDRNSSMSGLLAAFAPGDGVPAFNDDNWSEDLVDINGHTPDDIRRAAWKATIAGGVGFHVRNNALFCPHGITECDRYFRMDSVISQLNAVGWLARVNPFVQNRLGTDFGDMVPDPGLVASGPGHYALANTARSTLLFFLLGQGDTWDLGSDGPLTLNLEGLAGSYTATWFDPRTGSEMTAGSIPGGATSTLILPSTADHVLLLERDSS